MPRNFDRRVEVMFPIEADEPRQRICDEIIPIYMRDNTRARILMPEGNYVRAAASQGGEEFRSQRELLNSTQPLMPSLELKKEPGNGHPSEVTYKFHGTTVE
jgi:polyphosphate kinase